MSLGDGEQGLALVAAQCCVCGTRDAEPVGVGEDFEYLTSPDTFLAVKCRSCGLVYLDPRPAATEFGRIYPDTYHAFDFSDDRYGLVFKVRRRLEARRILRFCRDLPADALITDIGCGDGFHLRLLQDYGRKSWRLQGIDLDSRAAKVAAEHGLLVHVGDVGAVDLPRDSVDLAFMIQTIEHVEDPVAALTAARDLLKPGGRLVIVTDNTATPDFALFRSRHWGGYHFPRHWNLFNRTALATLARNTGFEVDRVSTIVSPVNWTYSVRNALDDLGAPRRVVSWFGLDSPVALGVFTAIDSICRGAGHGALLRAELRRPR
jgi:SAM-dependent methyltransferase